LAATVRNDDVMLSPLTHDDPHGFGSYRLTARLGGGGMGTVYLARSRGGRVVALKTMNARIAADTVFRTRFRLETDAARVIGGQYGAEVVDADPGAETPWMATEYVLGPPLDDAVELSGPLPEVTVRAVGAALCGALGQLHRSDVVHRDLKPSNIMITAYGPKLIDFGIARAIGDPRLTRTGNAAGTPAFMSPEQASGEEHAPAGDVFALAGVLVFAATGRAAFGWGQAADLLYRVRYAEPDLSGVPAELVPLLARALDKDPARRPTTGEFAAQLHDGSGEFADHLTVPLLSEIGRRASEVWQFTPVRLPAPAVQPPEPATRPPRRGPSRRALLTVGGGAVLAAAAGVGTWAWPRQAQKADAEWQVQVVGDRDDVSAPVAALVAGDLVAVTNGHALDGVDVTRGELAWRSGESARTWQVASDGRRLYRMVGPSEAEGKAAGPGGSPLLLSAVDPGSGKAGEPFAEITDVDGAFHKNQLLCAAGGVLYVAAALPREASAKLVDSRSWRLLAIDAASGKQRWSRPLKSRAPGEDRLLFLSAAAVGDLLVLLREEDNGNVNVVARDAGSGKVAWVGDKPVDVPRKHLERNSLSADGDHLYVGGSLLRALRLSDGKQRWAAEPRSSGGRFGLPSVRDGVVYAVEKGRGLVAVDARDGGRKWTEKGGDGGNAFVTDSPVAGSRHVYSASPEGLRAVDVSSHTTAATYRTRGTRFVAHERAGKVVAVGGRSVAGYPLR
jgi:eukaryotic-like serine/threonine-protein kinase